MLILKSTNRESGFTLVEIMIGMGLLAMLALMISSLMYYSAKQQQKIQHRGEVFEFQQALQYDLRTQPIPSPSP